MKLLENLTGKKACYKTKFSFSEKDDYFCFAFKAYNSTFNSYSNQYNDDLYKGDVCELFIKYGKENHYYEIEVAPNGATFLADIENINGNFNGTRLKDCFVKTSAKIKKNCYLITILIPKSFIETKKVEFNAFRIETDGLESEKHLFALHPTLSNTFHKIEFLK